MSDPPVPAATTDHTEWLTVKEFAQRNPGVSEWLIGDMVRRGELDHVRLGRRVLLPENALRVLADKQAQGRAAHNGHTD